jgi:hypothetical protein
MSILDVSPGHIKKAETLIEKVHMKNRKYIACEDFNFDWDEDELKRFDQLYGRLDIIELSTYFERPTEEIAFLIIDRAAKDKIDPTKREDKEC